MLENLMADLRRVYCLYRVSTLGQVEKDDIPMQKQYCREFVGQHPGWEIIKDFRKKAFPVLRSQQKIGMPFKKFSVMPCRTNSIFCWYLCLTDWGAERTKRLLL